MLRVVVWHLLFFLMNIASVASFILLILCALGSSFLGKGSSSFLAWIFCWNEKKTGAVSFSSLSLLDGVAGTK